MSATQTVGAAAPPPATDGNTAPPDKDAWNNQVKQAQANQELGEMGTSLIGGIMMQMLNSTKSDGEEEG